MTFIGQIELTKKKPPKVTENERAWQDLYDTLNHLIDAVNSKKTTEIRRPGNLQGSVGDLKVFKDKTDGKYYLEAMTEDGSARRELAITDKDVRTGKGYYSTAGIPGEGGTGGSEDSRNVEQQLFEAIPWTNGTPNNVVTNSDGQLVVDNVPGETVSNNNIAEANLVGDTKVFAAGQKPNKVEVDSDGKFVSDGTTSSTIISNTAIIATDIIGAGKAFATDPLSQTDNPRIKTTVSGSAPTATAVGDLWINTSTDDNLMYRAESIGADEITSGEWVKATPTDPDRTATIIGNTVTAAYVNAFSITADAVSASSITGGTMTTGAINIGSGKAQITSGGDAIFSSGAIKFDGNGNVHFQGDASAGGVIYFHAGNDTKNYSDSAFRLHHNESGNVLTINYDGSNKFFLENDGDLQVAGGFRFGDIGNNDIGFDQDGGNSISVQMNVNGSSMMPAVHASGSPGSNTVGYDLGKSTQKWRKVWGVDGNFGDLIIDNQVNARWILREQPDCILARNCKTQKTFKLNMTETSDYNDELWEDEQTT